MSTRAYIGKIDENGAVTVIYNHSDGYPSYLGYLALNYIDESNIDNILALGYISSLNVTENILAKIKSLDENKVGKRVNNYDLYLINYYSSYVEVENSLLSAYSANSEDTTVTYNNCGEMLSNDLGDIEYIYLFDTRTKIWKYVDMHKAHKTVRRLYHKDCV